MFGFPQLPTVELSSLRLGMRLTLCASARAYAHSVALRHSQRLKRGRCAVQPMRASSSATTIAPYCEFQRADQQWLVEPRPLAIVVGWFGAELKHVRKYADMYRSAGWDAVAVAPPSLATLVPPVADVYGDMVLRAVAKHVVPDVSNRDVLVHVASNGGFIFAGNLMLKGKNGDATARAIFERTRGVVFDCTPGNLRPDIVARAANAVFFSGESATSEPAPVLETLSSLLMNAGPVMSRLRSIDGAWGKISTDDDDWLNCPSLFMYSEADVLISPREIEEYARIREKKGKVVMHRYLDAAHCEIGRVHRDDYRDKLNKFLEEIVAQ